MPIKLRAESLSTEEVTLSSTPEGLLSIAPLLFGHVPEEDVSSYQSKELEKAATLAGKALLAQKTGHGIIQIDHDTVTRNGTMVSVITLVNDNKPFLFDSVMGEINSTVAAIYLVAHPVLDIAVNADGSLIISPETTSGPAPEGKRRISLMQIHVQPLGKTQSSTLCAALETVMEQVSAVVKDWQPMLHHLNLVTEHYRTNPPEKREKDTARAADFLEWLKDGNFIFLGMREYTFQSRQAGTEAFKPQGIELGILTDASIRILRDPEMQKTPHEIFFFMKSPDLMIVTKAKIRSLVHRRGWLDYIGIKLFDEHDQIKGELRIVGLFTATAYTVSVLRIPYLRPKVESAIDLLGFNPADHSGRALLNIFESYPRDEMFRIDVETLAGNTARILELGERPRIRVLADADPFGHFVSVLVFVPRDRYDTTVCKKIGNYLLEAYEGDFFEFTPLFFNATLTRIHYVVHRKGGTVPAVLQARLETTVGNFVRNWEDSISASAMQQQINPDILALAISFPDSYRDVFSPDAALHDAESIAGLSETKSLHVEFYHHRPEQKKNVSLKLFHRNEALELSQRVPLLENMGFRVIAEQTFEMPGGHGDDVYLHDMELENAFGQEVGLTDGGKLLADAFEAIWSGDVDDDGFNGLTQSAGLDWRKIVILRAYGRYLQQAGVPYSQDMLAQTLNRYPAITRDLYGLFCLRFDPSMQKKDREAAEQKIQQRIETELQDVPNLDNDRIIRAFRNLIAASLRSNAFTPEKDGSLRRTLAIKLNPREIDNLPEPRPYREIFVYGPEVEGVHLRFGPVARGGIRWSDRKQDYRTEILGLVKAQQVKNAVIVPAGSKGGFYPLRLPATSDRAALGEAARQAYILYISAMLSITDNIHDGKVVPAEGIVRYDGDDPYFVVAADKGTATFSDTANMISQSYDFWLDDAFASGGSAGYDHKKMGITAKGAWEAVKRHFREMNHDIQNESFRAVGVGDMSGDVFGNGMLLSRKIQLIAAFDHRDIFIDPDPDSETAYSERRRLFELPRSSWQNYDPAKISSGGGVFSRSLKTVILSPEAAKAIGFDKQSGTPFEIINAILKADVDLLWFGGIGTYIRGSQESDAQVGDHANDAIRVTGTDIRAKVIGEGANLGMTQRGRIEYAMKGGRCNTDAMDNSAGVNCSDVEVNIKIALAAAMRANKLTREERNRLLKKMTPEVARLVLRNNYLQPLALSLAERRTMADLPYQIRFMNDLERNKLLDRKVEVLPDNQTLTERQTRRKGLTRPELSVLMAYAKNTLEQEITASPVSEDPYFEKMLFDYFPSEMHGPLTDEIANHQLRRDIIATILANDIVNHGGPTFVARLQDKTGYSADMVIRAYILVRDGFAIPALYDAIDACDNEIPGDIQNTFYAAILRMLFSTTAWILRNVKLNEPLATRITVIRSAYQTIEKQLQQLIPDYMREELDKQAKAYKAQGAPDTLAHQLALLEMASVIPDIVLVSHQARSELIRTAETYFALAEALRINRIEEASRNIPVVDYYDGMALDSANDTIAESLRRVVKNVLQRFKTSENPADAWLKAEENRINDIIRRMNALIERDLNISRFTVAAGMMANLTKASA